MNRMDGTSGRERRSALHGISRRSRAALAAVGLMSWLAGGAASFMSMNGAGAAALVAAGTIFEVLALMGRWPTRISMSGNEFLWEDVRETVNSQIEMAEKSGEPDVLRELKELRARLDTLQRTGTVPELPAETYDKSVEAAIRRILPGAEVRRQAMRRNDVADFVVRHRGEQLFVETKWREEGARPFGGTTLPRLTQSLPPAARLLVVVNTDNWRPGTAKIVEQAMGDRGRIISWRDGRDDNVLAEALGAALGAAYGRVTGTVSPGTG
jgi:hypothetical protein